MNCFIPILLTALFSGQFVIGYQNKANHTPKADVGWTDSCDECQTIIKRIVDVAKDPTKVAELKMLLSVLCRETGYEEECRLFVSKIDLFLDRLLPYLKDAHHVCQELHICGNRRLEQFHRVGILYARKFQNETEAKNSLICEECQFAAHELLTLVDDPNVQQDVQDWLEENVCARMGSYKDMCDQYLGLVLPQFWQEVHNMLTDSKKFCEDLELCPASLAQGRVAAKNWTASSFALNAFLQSAAVGQTPFNAQRRDPGCLECEIFVEAIRHELSRNKTIYRLATQLQKVCTLIPTTMRDGCDDFMQMYSPAIVFLAVQHFFDNNTCKRIRLCTDRQHFDSTLRSDRQMRMNFNFECDSCRAINDIVQIELSSQRQQRQDELIQVLDKYLCGRVPASWHAVCYNLVQSYIPATITEMLRKLQGGKICYKIHACRQRP